MRLERRATLPVFVAAVLLAPVRLSAQEPAPVPPACGSRDTLRARIPYSDEDDRDGARSVWFANCRLGLPYAYLATADVPKSELFVEIDSTLVRAGDIAWWHEFM